MCFTSSQHGWLGIVFHFRHGDRLGERKQGKRNREDWEGRPGSRQPSIENRAHTLGLPCLLPAGPEVLSHQAEDLPQSPSELGCMSSSTSASSWVGIWAIRAEGSERVPRVVVWRARSPHFSSEYSGRLTSYPVFQGILGAGVGGGLGTDSLALLFWQR